MVIVIDLSKQMVGYNLFESFFYRFRNDSTLVYLNNYQKNYADVKRWLNSSVTVLIVSLLMFVFGFLFLFTFNNTGNGIDTVPILADFFEEVSISDFFVLLFLFSHLFHFFCKLNILLERMDGRKCVADCT